MTCLPRWRFRAADDGPQPRKPVRVDLCPQVRRQVHGPSLQLLAIRLRRPAPLLGVFHAAIVVPPKKSLQSIFSDTIIEPSTHPPKRSMSTLLQLQAATVAARDRTGDKHIGTQVARGLVDVIRAVPPASGRGRYTVTILRSGLSAAQAVAHLESMR